MKRHLLTAILCLSAVGALAQPINQTARRTAAAAALPATCYSSAQVKDMLWRNAVGWYVCTAANTWTQVTSGAAPGTVTSVGNGTIGTLFAASWATATTTPALSLDFVVQSGRKFLASPSDGSSGAITARAIVAADIPTLNQSTTQNAGTASASDHTPGACAANTFAQSQSTVWAFTCTSLVLAGAQFANQGTTTTLLHGAAAGNPAFGSVVSADLNITTTTCTNQFISALSSAAAGTCTGLTLAGAQFANQGTTTTVLHGAVAGNPSFAAVSMTADVSGTLPIGNGGTGNTTGTATHIPNLTGPIASTDTATSITSQTGTGTTFVMSAAPAITGTGSWDSPTLGIDSTNHRVGIGTASPTAVLDVLGAQTIIRNSSGGMNVQFGDASGNAAGILTFRVSNSATNWRISSNNNIAGGLEFIPSTAGGGNTYSTAALSVGSGGTITYSGPTPAVSNTTANSCGTTAATITGNDTTGVVTVGATAGTNCTMTFVAAALTRRQCVINNETTANLARSTYLTTTTSTFEGTFVAGDKISYICAVY